jgi:Leucine-rich repeat (LRR) protein
LNSFPELTYLSLEDNNLSFVDISQNPKLKYLRIGNNNSSNPWILDLDNNPLLEYVTLDDLGLESLILDHQYLYYLDVDGNDFIFFDVTNLPSLISLDASDNYDMTSITGFNGKQYLQYLGFEESAISGHVDFADMPLLRTIRVEYNQITSVSFVNLPALEYLNME